MYAVSHATVVYILQPATDTWEKNSNGGFLGNAGIWQEQNFREKSKQKVTLMVFRRAIYSNLYVWGLWLWQG